MLQNLSDRWRAFQRERRAAREREQLEKVLAALETGGPQARFNAIGALCGLGSPEAVAALIGTLDDPVPWVRIDAGQALALVEAPEAMEPLLRLFRSDPDHEVRRMSGVFVSVYDDPRIVAAWLAALADPHPGVIASACSGIRRRRVTAAIPALFELLYDLRSSVRREAGTTLVALGARDDQILETLFELLDDPDSSVQKDACAALLDLGIRDDRIVAALQSAAADPRMKAMEQFAREVIVPFTSARRKRRSRAAPDERNQDRPTYRTIEDLLAEARRPPEAD